MHSSNFSTLVLSARLQLVWKQERFEWRGKKERQSGVASTRDSVVHTQMMAHTRRGSNCFDAVMGISLSNRATMFPRAGFLRVVHILGRSQRHVKSRLGSGRRSLMRDSSPHGSHPHRQTNEEFASRKVKVKEFYSFQIDLSRNSIVFFG